MKYVIGEMLKIFAPFIIIIAVFATGLTVTVICRRRNPEKAENFRKPLSAAYKLIIGFGTGFLALFLLAALIVAFLGVPAQR